ncbi:DUF6528 family protein [Streptacidiphilus sp. P02-A3a]|uniref:DUF6528 family protein n=1 Tax=Streptacidiphilus sp. P02-A3a TaxID=2704468 RepID=UPI0015FCF788|nr:DUF6528 family protein [Streptacidiphilus sp. P02-A3a]QMU70508.1 DNRLRE domain-containing protein [Streptacidiphilus sp. P02-A3a]
MPTHFRHRSLLWRLLLTGGTLLLVLGAATMPHRTRPVTIAAQSADTSTTTAAYPVVQSGPQSIIHRVQDTWISNVDTVDHSQSSLLHIGTPDGKTAYRSFLAFDVSKLKGASIKSASLRLFNSETGSCAGWWMYAYPVNSAWNQSTITWANQPAVNTSSTYSASSDFGIGATGCPVHPNFTDPDSSDGIHRLDLTAMVTAWANGTLPNDGLRLSAGEEGAEAYKTFCSMNPTTYDGSNPCTIAYNTPTLEVTYNTSDAVVAAGNATTKTLDFYDGSQPSTWNSTGLLQQWAPDAYHSINDTTLVPAGTWSGGVDTKLRPGGVWGGQVMVTADNTSGFVGVIPYPALAGYKWAINVGNETTSNVHGVEMMPDGNVAVALTQTNQIEVFSKAQGEDWDTSSHTPAFTTTLGNVHELLYDPSTTSLWAVAWNALVQYAYVTGTDSSGNPTVQLVQENSYPIPNLGTAAAQGHDIQPVYGNPDRFWIAAANGGVTQFSKSGTGCAVTTVPTGWPATTSPGVGTRWCEDYPGAAQIDSQLSVRSIGNDPASGTVAETWPDPAPSADDWTTPQVTFFPSSGTAGINASVAPTAAYYRARWLVPSYN